ncbi:MAG: precorrin-6A synthase (deacetylating) [Lawsonella sp.]|uniref:precorrin-6A synthase (deacetylating) n=1 Tax=Lawsonella sp. TaxID=2041415 RepID=UPI002A74B55F|nr:precorrin-6A synthase (deacetylating) [Lawsonella sp.]MDY2979202.1 precorrin-6A synthase (deacetylating) [Lawsonella sp.]
MSIIGIGTGGAEDITLSAITEMRQLDLVVFLDKGSATADMRTFRRTLLSQHSVTATVLELHDPPRDRHPVDYQEEVKRWHQARADLISEALQQALPEGGRVGFLVWGDPSLYDSTLRIVRAMEDETRIRVIPGVSAVHALTAAFGLVANDIGGTITITTGRKLSSLAPMQRENVFVMLDGRDAYLEVATPDTYIYWGAYLRAENEVLREGYVADVGPEIAALKKELHDRNGWVMDTYLLREIRS